MRLALIALLLTTAAAQSYGYRYDTQVYGGTMTITERQTYYDNGMRYVPDEVPPNRCDEEGLAGFEVMSGPRRQRVCVGQP